MPERRGAEQRTGGAGAAARIEAEVERAVELDKRALARLISLFEDARPRAARARQDVLAALDRRRRRCAAVIGVTGPPGVGKSTLLGRIACDLVSGEGSPAVAVLAVDPTSRISGGALLGDRTRVKFPPGERRLFFRSQASERELGGVGRATFQVCRLLRRLFDVLFVETVGIGQSEIDVEKLADVTLLVLQPRAGDTIQLMKAGVMEIPDAIALNKCDEGEPADAAFHALTAGIGLSRPGAPPPLHRVSALTGVVVRPLAVWLLEAARAAPTDEATREAYFFEKWVLAEYGRRGLARLAAHVDSTAQFVAEAGGFDAAQVAAEAEFSS